MAKLSRVRGLLIDVDGVLHVDGEEISGAAEALHRIREAGIAIRLLTNGTMRTRVDLSDWLRGMGFDVSSDETLTAVTATADYLRRNHPGVPCHLLVSGDIAGEFDSVRLTDDETEAGVVVVGGASDSFSFAALNRAYRMLHNGAKLVAMHKSAHWLTSEGITLDSGPYIHGLEWAAGTEAVVVGKPSPHFFQMGFNELGLQPSEVAMVGDDPIQDVQGAMDCGAMGILVRTGLGAIEPVNGFDPDLTLSSIASLPDLLQNPSAA